MSNMMYNNVLFDLFSNCKCQVSILSQDNQYILQIIKKDNNNIYTCYFSILNDFINDNDILEAVLIALKDGLDYLTNENKTISKEMTNQVIVDVKCINDNLVLELSFIIYGNKRKHYHFSLREKPMDPIYRLQLDSEDKNIIIDQLQQQQNELMQQIDKQSNEIIQLKEELGKTKLVVINDLVNKINIQSNEIADLKLSLNKLSEALINHNNISHGNKESICIESQNNDSFNHNLFHFDYLTPFDVHGMLYFIGTKCGKTPYINPHTANYLTVSSKSLLWGSLDAIVNQNYLQNYIGDNEPGSWIRIDLGINYKAKITSFWIRHSSSNSYFIRNYELSCSNSDSIDNDEWVVISKQTNNSPIYKPEVKLAVAHIACNTPANEFYRYIRLKQIGINSNGYYQMVLSGIEFYGDLISIIEN